MFSGTAGDKNSPETDSRNPSLFPPPHPLFPLHLLNTKLMFQLLATLLFNVFHILIICQLPYFPFFISHHLKYKDLDPTSCRFSDPLLKVNACRTGIEPATTNDLLKNRRIDLNKKKLASYLPYCTSTNGSDFKCSFNFFISFILRFSRYSKITCTSFSSGIL
jgi:hypothetical protein